MSIQKQSQIHKKEGRNRNNAPIMSLQTKRSRVKSSEEVWPSLSLSLFYSFPSRSRPDVPRSLRMVHAHNHVVLCRSPTLLFDRMAIISGELYFHKVWKSWLFSVKNARITGRGEGARMIESNK